MAESSRRAARLARKGGRPNALFLASSVEQLPSALDRAADLVTVTFPWGSLLRGALGLDAALTDAIDRLVGPCGQLAMLVSVTPRDRVEGLDQLDDGAVAEIVARHAARGLRCTEARPATADDLAASRSTWARRIAVGASRGGRPAWRVAFVREGRSDASPDAGSATPLR